MLPPSRSQYEFDPRNLSTINTHFSSQSSQDSISIRPFIPLTLTSEPRVISNAKNRIKEDTPSSRAAATKREIPILCLKRVKNIHTIKDICAEDVVRALVERRLSDNHWREEIREKRQKRNKSWIERPCAMVGWVQKKEGKITISISFLLHLLRCFCVYSFFYFCAAVASWRSVSRAKSKLFKR